MKKELEIWKNYINEAADEFQDVYESTLILNFSENLGLDRKEFESFIRAIENVTTVTRVREVSVSGDSYVGEFAVRFVLSKGKDAKLYYDTVLKPGIKKIRGLSIEQDKGYESIE
jgi:hypothetical protein